MGEMTPSRPRCIKRAPNINEFLPLRNDASSVDCFGQLNLSFQVLVDSVSANTLNQNLQILRNPVVRFGMKWLISHVSDKKKICAVGTTVIRAIESSVSTSNTLKPYDQWTNKFIFPPYDFSIANCMITNFHMPESTLLMMVSAFTDYDLLMEAYKQAVKEKYRFLSYGDAMLIL